MRHFPGKIIVILLILNYCTGDAQIAGEQGHAELRDKFSALTKNTAYDLVGEVEIKFDTYHTQGILKIGEYYYLSSVEVTEERRRLEQPDEQGYYRTPGKGIGHLFKIDADGNLVKDLVMLDGGMYHPSGIDFDGTHIWIGLAAYRPQSEAKIYKVDIDKMQAEEMFSVSDHIGGLVYDRDANLVYGLSWGSRTIYCWTPEGSEKYRYNNASHYVDFQDAKYVGANMMLASGKNNLKFDVNGTKEVREIGGMALIELATGNIIHAVPVMLSQGDNTIITRNPMDVEIRDGKLTFYFAPEDNQTTIYIYQAW